MKFDQVVFESVCATVLFFYNSIIEGETDTNKSIFAHVQGKNNFTLL